MRESCIKKECKSSQVTGVNQNLTSYILKTWHPWCHHANLICEVVVHSFRFCSHSLNSKSLSTTIWFYRPIRVHIKPTKRLCYILLDIWNVMLHCKILLKNFQSKIYQLKLRWVFTWGKKHVEGLLYLFLHLKYCCGGVCFERGKSQRRCVDHIVATDSNGLRTSWGGRIYEIGPLPCLLKTKFKQWMPTDLILEK